MLKEEDAFRTSTAEIYLSTKLKHGVLKAVVSKIYQTTYAMFHYFLCCVIRVDRGVIFSSSCH